jgi:ERO1-like protein alpha
MLFLQLQGNIDDCLCNVDTVDAFNNNQLFPRLKSLLSNDFFRFYKVDLARECPFWEDDSKCAIRYCHVETCVEVKKIGNSQSDHFSSKTAQQADIPPGLKGNIENTSRKNKVDSKNNLLDAQFHESNFQYTEEAQSFHEKGCDTDTELGYLNTTIR